MSLRISHLRICFLVFGVQAFVLKSQQRRAQTGRAGGVGAWRVVSSYLEATKGVSEGKDDIEVAQKAPEPPKRPVKLYPCISNPTNVILLPDMGTLFVQALHLL
jgi:hypothetical protein